jgi:hypothetical protein
MELIPLYYHEMDQWIGCIVGMIAGFILQGEIQVFFVLLFQNLSERKKVIYDLNPFHHIDPAALPVILLTGWGWGKKRVEVPSYFPQNKVARSIIHLTAPIGNLCLMGVLGSIYMFWQGSILKFAIQINALNAVANFFIPICPMALGRALCTLVPKFEIHRSRMALYGAILLTLLVIWDFWTKAGIFQWLLVPSARFISRLIMGG